MQFQAQAFRGTSTTRPNGSPMRRREDVALGELIDRYEARGGFATSDEVAGRMRSYWRQPISILARWIVSRKLVSFDWRGQIMLPLFQFEQPRMSPQQGIVEVINELAELMEDQDIAEWFVRPNDALDLAMPVDVVLRDPDAVLDAARCTRRALSTHRLHALVS